MRSRHHCFDFFSNVEGFLHGQIQMLADGLQNHLLLLPDLDVDWTNAKNDPGRYRNPKMAVFEGTRLLYYVHV